jgi:hypothetical protein
LIGFGAESMAQVVRAQALQSRGSEFKHHTTKRKKELIGFYPLGEDYTCNPCSSQV